MNKPPILGNLSLDDLKKVTWDYSDVGIIGYYGEIPIKGWMFEAIDFRCPILVRRCNVSEGWIEYFSVKGEEPRTMQDFGRCCEIVRDDNGEPIVKREKYHGRLSIIDARSKDGKEIVIIS